MTEPAQQHARELAAAVDAMLDHISRAHAHARAEFNLSELELRILRELRHGETTIGALARATCANRSSISMATRRLEQRRLLRRTSTGRTTRVVLNDEVLRQLRDICCTPLERGVQQWLDDDASADAARHADAVQLARQIAGAYDRALRSRTQRATCDQLHAALRRGDADVAYDLALSLVDAGRTRAAHDALASAMHQVGDAWQRGEIGVADERIATSACRRVIDRLHLLVRPSGARSDAEPPRALVVAAPGERHDLALQLVANELELCGWTVDLMLGDVPAPDLAELCARRSIDASFVGITRAEHLDDAASLVAALAPRTTVFVGGQALQDPDAASRLVAAGAGRVLRLDELDQAATRLRRTRHAA